MRTAVRPNPATPDGEKMRRPGDRSPAKEENCRFSFARVGPSDTVRCGEFRSDCTEAETRAEAVALFPGLTQESRSVACDVCFRRLMAEPRKRGQPVPVAIQRLLDEVKDPTLAPQGYDRYHGRHNRS